MAFFLFSLFFLFSSQPCCCLSYLPLSSVLLADIEFRRTNGNWYHEQKKWKVAFFWLIIYNTCNCDLLYNIIENKFSLNKNSTSGDPAWLFFLTNAWKKHGNTMEVLHREMVVEKPRKYHGSMIFINGLGKTGKYHGRIGKKWRIYLQSIEIQQFYSIQDMH